MDIDIMTGAARWSDAADLAEAMDLDDATVAIEQPDDPVEAEMVQPEETVELDLGIEDLDALFDDEEPDGPGGGDKDDKSIAI